MKKRKILLSIGTRPEAIKMAPLYLSLINSPEFITKLLVTAQHRNLLDDVLKIFKIKPDYDLNIMTDNQSLYKVNIHVLSGMEKILENEIPDILLVHGDTLTTMASSIAAYYKRIPVAHVEAGLRTNDIYNPFPEEMNRKVTDSVSTLLFAPTKNSKENLLKENISSDKIFVTGNTVVDSLLMISKLRLDYFNENLRKIITDNLCDNKKIILMTIHRRENFGKPIEEIFQAVRDIALKYRDIIFIYPVHPNPNVKEKANKILSRKKNIFLIEPVNYFDFIKAVQNCYFILTDSGGIQEEAPSFSKPVLVARSETERPEAVEKNTAILVGNRYKDVYKNLEKLLSDIKLYKKMISMGNPFGDGLTSNRIRDCLLNYFKIKKVKIKEFL